ncbi:hypothetical protein EVAR_44641_1 [Eumeta japonica]|uniref:Uncharacterized protein n=1 Tax=Eumeta variegata TaxID=151549 RepID=A0A4C1ZRK7_EUMVA|nr:hypothetical protein EVAR_44635_1 [Eumeta japonica]GBP89764.1 hypothetical protein EVAR_44641_1 [Eumeta japonica]
MSTIQDMKDLSLHPKVELRSEPGIIIVFLVVMTPCKILHGVVVSTFLFQSLDCHCWIKTTVTYDTERPVSNNLVGDSGSFKLLVEQSEVRRVTSRTGRCGRAVFAFARLGGCRALG